MSNAITATGEKPLDSSYAARVVRAVRLARLGPCGQPLRRHCRCRRADLAGLVCDTE